jgi:hypothetical protein
MDADQVAMLRALLAPTGWLDRTALFARALRQSTRKPRGLLIMGTPVDEPWHMTAHLLDESKLAGIPELEPTFVRWSPPLDAKPHLSIGLERLRAASRGETLLVVSGELAPPQLLERVHDVRKLGATIFALDGIDPELDELAHESLGVSPASAPVTFDAAQHLVSAAATDLAVPPDLRSVRGGYVPGQRHSPDQHGSGFRARLARLLDAVSGTPTD